MPDKQQLHRNGAIINYPKIIVDAAAALLLCDSGIDATPETLTKQIVNAAHCVLPCIEVLEIKPCLAGEFIGNATVKIGVLTIAGFRIFRNAEERFCVAPPTRLAKGSDGNSRFVRAVCYPMTWEKVITIAVRDAWECEFGVPHGAREVTR